MEYFPCCSIFCFCGTKGRELKRKLKWTYVPVRAEKSELALILVLVASVLHLSGKKKLKKGTKSWPSIQILKYRFKSFLGISLLETLTYADSPSKGFRKHLKQLRYFWIYPFLGIFMSRKMQNT